MSSKKKNQKTNPNKRKNDETVIICPYCGGTHFEYTAEKRRVPSKWYVHVITAIVIIGIAFVMPYFSIAFAIAYVVLTFMPRKVLVGTCKDCGEETLFNRPEDGSMKPSFDQPHLYKALRSEPGLVSGEFFRSESASSVGISVWSGLVHKIALF